MPTNQLMELWKKKQFNVDAVGISYLLSSLLHYVYM